MTLLFILLKGFVWEVNAQKLEGGDKLELIFITTCVDEDFFKPVMKGMNEAADLMKVDCAFTGTVGVNIEEQVRMMEEAIDDGVDGIALNIIDSQAFDEVVKRAIKKGIPVVTFNGDDTSTPNDRLSAVVQDHLKAGRLFGEKIIPYIKENSTILVTQHSKGISALDDRFKGMQDILKEKNIDFKVVITSNQADKASKVIIKVMEENPEITTILCTGLADTEGAGMAIRSDLRGRDIVAAGFDLSPSIVDFIKGGQLLFTVDQQPYMQGYYPVIQLTQFLRYGIVPSNNEIGAAFVTSDNVIEVGKLIDEGYR